VLGCITLFALVLNTDAKRYPTGCGDNIFDTIHKMKKINAMSSYDQGAVQIPGI
jgi:hypothetical protein